MIQDHSDHGQTSKEPMISLVSSVGLDSAIPLDAP